MNALGTFTAIRLSQRQLADVELLRVEGYRPLTGFMNRADYTNVVDNMRLADGRPWPLPITLAVDQDTADAIREGDKIPLLGLDRAPVAFLEVEEKFRYDKPREARLVFRTTDEAHPGVAALYAQGDTLLGGTLTHTAAPISVEFAAYRHTPADLAALYAQRGWRSIVAFQTRNPIHRAHEYLQKAALEMVDGLLVHPIVGATKDDDVPADVRMRCYEVLLEKYFPPERVLLSVLPAAMRYAGPREAIFHALVRRNYGCTHFIVGRDHAGVGNYYGPYDAQVIFDEFAPGELGITPLFFEHAFWCNACAGMATSKTCPHDNDAHVFLSGTRLREMMRANESPPPEFTRSEVAEELARHYQRP